MLPLEPFCEREVPRTEGGCLAGQVSDNAFQWVLFQRHGRRPLGLRARALLHADNRCSGTQAWSELALYETDQRRLATVIQHRILNRPGGSWIDTALHEALDDARARLLSHDPTTVLPPSVFASRHLLGQEYSCVHSTAQFIDLSVFRGRWSGLVCALLGLGRDQVAAPSGVRSPRGWAYCDE